MNQTNATWPLLSEIIASETEKHCKLDISWYIQWSIDLVTFNEMLEFTHPMFQSDAQVIIGVESTL